MHTSKKGYWLLTSLLGMVLCALPVNAQGLDGFYSVEDSYNVSQSLTDRLIFILTPQNPEPNTVVTIEVKTGATDIKRANVGWLVNGNLIESGVGKTKHTLVTGKRGTPIRVTAIVQSVEGIVYEKEIVLRPASVDLIWEAQTNTPPFYRGKTLYTLLGNFKVIAIPDVVDAEGLKIDPDKLSYKWTKDGRVYGQLSGFGRNTFIPPSPGFRLPFTVSVVISDTNGINVAEKSITIVETQPKLLLYENSPLYGVLFNRDIGNSVNLRGREIAVEAFPYFFNTSNRASLSYVWKVNYIIEEGFTGPFITLRTEEGTRGNAMVSLEVKNPRVFTEYLSRNINISFGN